MNYDNRKAMTRFSLRTLEKSLNPLPHELNELDWKTDVSSKGAPNLAKHISAFANYTHGGYLVFGIDDHGQTKGL